MYDLTKSSPFKTLGVQYPVSPRRLTYVPTYWNPGGAVSAQAQYKAALLLPRPVFEELWEELWYKHLFKVRQGQCGIVWVNKYSLIRKNKWSD